jgi:hypothetical protein
MKEHRVDHGQDRLVRANDQRQREHGECGKCGRLAQAAQCKTYVLANIAHGFTWDLSKKSTTDDLRDASRRTLLARRQNKAAHRSI